MQSNDPGVFAIGRAWRFFACAFSPALFPPRHDATTTLIVRTAITAAPDRAADDSQVLALHCPARVIGQR